MSIILHFKKGGIPVKKILLCLALMLLSMSILAPFAMAAAEEAAKSTDKLGFFKAIGLASAICITVAAIAGVISQSSAVKGAIEGIARNPGASGKITIAMVVGLAFIESLVIYALVVVLILLFGDPFGIKI